MTAPTTDNRDALLIDAVYGDLDPAARARFDGECERDPAFAQAYRDLVETRRVMQAVGERAGRAVAPSKGVLARVIENADMELRIRETPIDIGALASAAVAVPPVAVPPVQMRTIGMERGVDGEAAPRQGLLARISAAPSWVVGLSSAAAVAVIALGLGLMSPTLFNERYMEAVGVAPPSDRATETSGAESRTIGVGLATNNAPATGSLMNVGTSSGDNVDGASGFNSIPVNRDGDGGVDPQQTIHGDNPGWMPGDRRSFFASVGEFRDSEAGYADYCEHYGIATDPASLVVGAEQAYHDRAFDEAVKLSNFVLVAADPFEPGFDDVVARALNTKSQAQLELGMRDAFVANDRIFERALPDQYVNFRRAQNQRYFETPWAQRAEELRMPNDSRRDAQQLLLPDTPLEIDVDGEWHRELTFTLGTAATVRIAVLFEEISKVAPQVHMAILDAADQVVVATDIEPDGEQALSAELAGGRYTLSVSASSDALARITLNLTVE